MAFTTDTVTSFTNLIDKLDIWMASNGWTSEHKDLTVNAGTGGEWAMRRTGVDLRFATTWDGANTPDALGIYHYVGQNYVSVSRPWGQDNDSGNGFAGTLDADLKTSRHILIGSAPVQFWAFEDDHYTHVVIETASGTYAHFGAGVLNKFGDWTGGSYVYGQKNSGVAGDGQAVQDDRSHLLDGLTNDTPSIGGQTNDMEDYVATIHCEGLPNQPAGGLFAVSMGGKAASPQTDFGTDRQSNDGVSADVARVIFPWGYRSGPFANGFHRIDGTDQSGHTAIWPVAPTYADSAGDLHGFPIGYMPGVGGLSMRGWSGGSEVVIGGDTWTVFPAHRRYPGTGSESGTSGYLGVAYKQVV